MIRYVDKDGMPVASVGDDPPTVVTDDEEIARWATDGVPGLQGIRRNGTLADEWITVSPDDPLWGLAVAEMAERLGWSDLDVHLGEVEFVERLHPRGRGGKWIEKATLAHLVSVVPPAPERPPTPARRPAPPKPPPKPRVPSSKPRPKKIPAPKSPYDPDAVFVGDDVERALALLAEGRAVRLAQTRQLSVLLDRIAEITRDAEQKGEKAPSYDLCKVTVEGASLFCTETKGIPRIKMPQLRGKPESGSAADKLPKDAEGSVDLTEMFVDYLRELGHETRDTEEHAAFMKATQNELNGVKVAKIMTSMRKRGVDSDMRMLITEEAYVVDGHHRWAGLVGLDAEDGRLGDGKAIPVTRIDMDIIELLQEAVRFTNDMGLPSAGFDAPLPGDQPRRKKKEGRSAQVIRKLAAITPMEQPESHERVESKDWAHPPPPVGQAGERRAGGYSADEAFGTNTKLGKVGEEAFLRIVGGRLLHAPGKGEQSPLDVHYNGYGFEVKSVSRRSTAYKATPKKYEIGEKELFAQELGIQPALAISVIDADANEVHIYYREGLEGGRLSERRGWKFLASGPLREEEVQEALWSELLHPRSRIGRWITKLPGAEVLGKLDVTVYHPGHERPAPVGGPPFVPVPEPPDLPDVPLDGDDPIKPPLLYEPRPYVPSTSTYGFSWETPAASSHAFPWETEAPTFQASMPPKKPAKPAKPLPPPKPPVPKYKAISAGVVLVERDGRLWLYEPANHFGGYQHTFPKGRVEGGDSYQKTALRELWEETGLTGQIVGIVGDYEGDTTITRYYRAIRTGGAPWAHKSDETWTVKLVSPEAAEFLLNRERDRQILADLDLEEAEWKSELHPRWPPGTPGGLGGQFMHVGQRFKLKGVEYDVAQLVPGAVIAHVATKGKKVGAKVVEIPTEELKVEGESHQVVKDIERPPAEPILLTSHKKGGKLKGTQTVVDPYAYPETHDPSIPIPEAAKHRIQPEHWKTFGRLDQLRFTQVVMEHGVWEGAGKAQAKMDVVLAAADPKDLKTLQEESHKQFGSSTGLTISGLGIFGAVKHWWDDKTKQAGDPAFEEARDRYERMKSLQDKTAAVIQWDLYHRTRGPDISLFHKSGYQSTYHPPEWWQSEIIDGDLPVFPGMSQSQDFSAIPGDSVFATPMAIRHIVIATISAKALQYGFGGEKEIANAESFAADSRSLAFSKGSLGGLRSKWLTKASEFGASGELLAMLRESIAANDDGVSLPVTPAEAHIQMVGSGAQNWTAPPQEAYAPALGMKYAELDDEGKPVARPINQLELKPGDYIEGMQGTRYIVIADPSLDIGIRSFKVTGPGTKIPGTEFKSVTGQEGAAYTDHTVWPSDTESYPFSGGGAKSFKKLDGHFDLTPPEPTGLEFNPANWTPVAADQAKFLKDYEVGEKFNHVNKYYEVTGKLGGGNMAIVDLVTGNTGQINGDYKSPWLVSEYVVETSKPKLGDTLALDGQKATLTKILKDGTLSFRKQKGGVVKIGPDDPILAYLHQPDRYEVGDKAKLKTMVIGQRFHGGTGQAIRPYLITEHKGKSVIVRNLDTGQEMEMSGNKSYARLLVKQSDAVKAPPQPQLVPNSPADTHDSDSWELGAQVNLGDVPVGGKFTAVAATDAQSVFTKIDDTHYTNPKGGEQEIFASKTQVVLLVPNLEAWELGPTTTLADVPVGGKFKSAGAIDAHAAFTKISDKQFVSSTGKTHVIIDPTLTVVSVVPKGEAAPAPIPTPPSMTPADYAPDLWETLPNVAVAKGAVMKYTGDTGIIYAKVDSLSDANYTPKLKSWKGTVLYSTMGGYEPGGSVTITSDKEDLPSVAPGKTWEVLAPKAVPAAPKTPGAPAQIEQVEPGDYLQTANGEQVALVTGKPDGVNVPVVVVQGVSSWADKVGKSHTLTMGEDHGWHWASGAYAPPAPATFDPEKWKTLPSALVTKAAIVKNVSSAGIMYAKVNDTDPIDLDAFWGWKATVLYSEDPEFPVGGPVTVTTKKNYTPAHGWDVVGLAGAAALTPPLTLTPTPSPPSPPLYEHGPTKSFADLKPGEKFVGLGSSTWEKIDDGQFKNLATGSVGFPMVAQPTSVQTLKLKEGKKATSFDPAHYNKTIAVGEPVSSLSVGMIYQGQKGGYFQLKSFAPDGKHAYATNLESGTHTKHKLTTKIGAVLLPKAEQGVVVDGDPIKPVYDHLIPGDPVAVGDLKVGDQLQHPESALILQVDHLPETDEQTVGLLQVGWDGGTSWGGVMAPSEVVTFHAFAEDVTPVAQATLDEIQTDLDALPTAPFDPYKWHKAGSGGLTYPKIKHMTEGVAFQDKGGLTYVVKQVGPDPIVSDGEALYKIDGDFRGKVVETPPFKDNAPIVPSTLPEVKAWEAEQGMVENVVKADFGDIVLQKGDSFTYDGHTYIVSHAAGDGPDYEGIYAVSEEGNTSVFDLSIKPEAYAKQYVPEVIAPAAGGLPNVNTGMSLAGLGLKAGDQFSHQDKTYTITAVEPGLFTTIGPNGKEAYWDGTVVPDSFAYGATPPSAAPEALAVPFSEPSDWIKGESQHVTKFAPGEYGINAQNTVVWQFDAPGADPKKATAHVVWASPESQAKAGQKTDVLVGGLFPLMPPPPEVMPPSELAPPIRMMKPADFKLNDWKAGEDAYVGELPVGSVFMNQTGSWVWQIDPEGGALILKTPGGASVGETDDISASELVIKLEPVAAPPVAWVEGEDVDPKLVKPGDYLKGLNGTVFHVKEVKPIPASEYFVAAVDTTIVDTPSDVPGKIGQMQTLMLPSDGGYLTWSTAPAPKPEPDEPSGYPDVLEPFKWHKSGQGQVYPRLVELGLGTIFTDKTGKEYILQSKGQTHAIYTNLSGSEKWSTSLKSRVKVA